MEFMTGKLDQRDRTYQEVIHANCPEGTISVHGAVHALRPLGGVTFLTLRMAAGALQCVCGADIDLSAVAEECAVVITGTVRQDKRAPGGRELVVESIDVKATPAAQMPVPIHKYQLKLNLDTELPLRPVVLRNLKRRSVFRIQEGLCRAFHEHLTANGFTEIHSPKIVHAGAEGGSNIFRMEYFNRRAFLTQSPQFYKQMMVGVFERVYEVGPVFRAEKHNTTRHLNEYTGLDFEMGYIDSFYDVMEMETGYLQHAMELLAREYADDLKRLNITLPKVEQIPICRFDEAKRLAAEKYHRPIRDPFDLEPEEEVNIGRYFQEEYGADFVFITHYPVKKRPFYAMDDPEDPRYTLSFDLLFRGMEITTGGQRIHDYEQQVAKMKAKRMNPEEFASYLMIHKYGMPPHGGLGIGLERLTMKLCDLDNVRYASLFPRDLSRLEP